MAFPWGAVIGGAGSLFGGMFAGRGMAAAGRYGQLAAKCKNKSIFKSSISNGTGEKSI